MPDRANDIEARAAHWAAIAHGGWPDSTEQLACETWLAQDLRHRGAFVRAGALLVVMEAAQDFAPADEITLPSFHDVEVSGRISRRKLLSGIAASAVAAVGLTRAVPAAHAASYTTELGEQRTVEFGDGLSFTLNTQSSATLRTRPGLREITLDRGEMAVAVLSGGPLPLTVRLPGIELVTRGAEFALSRLAAERTDILVTSGRVRLQNDRDRRDLDTGDFVRLLRGSVAEAGRMSSAEQKALLAWRDGTIDFQDVPLGDAAASFARYNKVAIRFASPDVADVRITGVFSLGRPRQFADAVAEALNLKVSHREDSVVLQEK